MHIGVDATCWQLPRGFGRHTRCLLTALRQVDPDNRYTFFTDSPAATEELSAIARAVEDSSGNGGSRVCLGD